MSDILIQERFSFDLNANEAVEQLFALSTEAARLRESIDRAKASGQAYEKTLEALVQTEQKFLNILGQEVNTYNGIVAKRKILAESLKTIEKGSIQYRNILKQVQDLEKRELNTIDGLNAKRAQLRTQLGQLEIGTKDYKRTLKDLQATEAKAAKATGDITKGAGSFTSALRGGLAAIGITVGLHEVIDFGKEALQASAEKQQQKNALLTALNNQEAVQERLLAQADQLEAATLVDDDDIIALDRYLASLGLTEKQIKTLNNASVQLAAVQGTTVRAAADKLIAAQNGQVRGIAKLVPEVKKLSKAQLAAGEAADIVANKFAGSAEALNTGVIGMQNRLKDITDNFKEAAGDSITRGLAKNVAAFSNLLGGGEADSNLKRFTDALTGTIEDIISIPAYAVAGIKAVFAGIGAGFDFIKNKAKIVFLDAQELFLKSQKFFNLQREGDLGRIADLQRARQVLEERTEGGFFGTIADAAGRAFDEALKGTDELAAGMKAVKKEGDDKTVDYLPKLKKDIKATKGSLDDLEAQLAKLREQVTKFTVADDKSKLQPLLIQIAALEKRIKDIKKLQDDLVAKPFAPFDQLPTTDIQAKTISDETEKAKIREQFIREQSAVQLRAIEEQQSAALQSATLTEKEKETIEAQFQAKREQLAIETDRAITANAIQQKQLELADLERTAKKPGENAEGIARVKAEIANLEAQLAALQNKTVNVDVKVDPKASKKVKDEIKAISDAAINLANQVTSALQGIFDRQTERATAAVEAQKTKLSDALQNSEDFTAQQIQIERDRLDQFQKEQERAAARAKALQIAQVIANSIIAISKAASQTGVGAPIAIISTIAAIAAGIAAAGALAGNAFYEGTDYVPLGNNKKGRDTIPARLHEGEGVIQADKNKAYHPAVKAIRRGEIPADILNDFVQSWKGGAQMNVPRARRTTLPDSVSGMNVGAGNQNFYFQAKLQKLEHEASQQTQILTRIEQNGRNQNRRQIKKAPNNGQRFV